MKEANKHKMWQMPWEYGESVAAVVGVIVVGVILQLTIGDFDFYLLAAPVNMILGGVIIAICILSVIYRTRAFFKWLSGVPFAVTLIASMLCLSLIMGLTPQISDNAGSSTGDIFSRVGFSRMTDSWPFVLTYFVLLVALGCLLGRRLYCFRGRDYAFYFNHVGLWLLLFASGLGSADMARYIMYVREGETQWRVYDSQENIKELPVAIELNDFDMEVYAPKLTVIDRETGEPQPQGMADYYQLDDEGQTGNLNGWSVKIEEYIHNAVRSSDSTYREVLMPGATPAVLVRMVNLVDGREHRGWVCGGNQAQLYMTLPLDEQYCVVMTAAEPKRFISDIKVYTAEGVTKQALLEVNKPLRTGSWTIYQYGYDNQAGRLSSYSSFELVYDPWIIPVYAGIILIMIGSVCMLWTGKPRKEAGYDVA